MAHNRKLVIGGVALVEGRFKNVGPAIDLVRNELEALIIECDLLARAPFQWIGLIIRLGLKDRWSPEYKKINKKHGDLPVSIEVDMRELGNANVEVLCARFRAATLEALIQIASKYMLPDEALLDAQIRRGDSDAESGTGLVN